MAERRAPLRFGVAYDFRNPPSSGIDDARLYAECLEQVVVAEQLGYDVAWLAEHHFVADGYLPSWVPVAGAMLARTTTLRVSTDIAVLPFHHPIRLAEDLAVLDNLSGGRIELGVGMGYVATEFAGLGVPLAERVSRTEEALDVLALAWSGERFRYQGRRFRFEDLRVRPDPVQPGGPPVWIAAMSEAGTRRAARRGAHFLPQGHRGDTTDLWPEALRSVGDDGAGRRVGMIRPALVTDDRARDWPPIRAAEAERVALYREFFTHSRPTLSRGRGERIPQTWVIGTAEEVFDELERFIEDYGVTDLMTWGCPPGMRPGAVTPHLVRFAEQVMPRLRARFG